MATEAAATANSSLHTLLVLNNFAYKGGGLYLNAATLSVDNSCGAPASARGHPQTIVSANGALDLYRISELDSISVVARSKISTLESMAQSISVIVRDLDCFLLN